MGKFLAEQEPDERGFNEWMRDQGLDAPGRGPRKIRPTWINKSAKKRTPLKSDVSITKKSISFSLAARDRMGPHILIGTGELDGEEVVLIRTAKATDKRAFKPTPNRTKTRYQISSERVLEALLPSALLGKYRLVAIKGGFYLAPEEGRTCESP